MSDRHPSDSEVLASGDFRSGFSIGETEADWFYFGVDPFVANGGSESTSAGGLRVVADGTNPVTAEPAFTNTVAQERQDGRVPASLDRTKWFVYQSRRSSNGVPGFDAQDGMELTCEAWIGGSTFGTAGHPFGKHVSNADDDLRLASFLLTTIDFETFMLFDFVMTNETIYALYERLPAGRPQLGNYAAFSYAIPVAPNARGRINHLEIAYDRARGTVRWLVDEATVFSVERIGARLGSREFMLLDNGGTDTLVRPNQLDCGFGLLTFLDGYGKSGVGLVRLSNVDAYFDPSVGEPTELDFVDNRSLEANRLFGQGAELLVEKYVVSTTRVR